MYERAPCGCSLVQINERPEGARSAGTAEVLSNGLLVVEAGVLGGHHDFLTDGQHALLKARVVMRLSEESYEVLCKLRGHEIRDEPSHEACT